MRYTKILILIAIALWASVSAAAAAAQLTPAEQAARDATRDKLRTLLDRVGPRLHIAFRQANTQPYNFVGTLTQGLKNAQEFETVISVTASETLDVRAYPHFKGGYINLDKARNSAALTRQMVQFNYLNFLFWGADDTGDIFAGYSFTLESGFPTEAIEIVLGSIVNQDQYVGQMRPAIDGSKAP